MPGGSFSARPDVTLATWLLLNPHTPGAEQWSLEKGHFRFDHCEEDPHSLLIERTLQCIMGTLEVLCHKDEGNIRFLFVFLQYFYSMLH